MYICIFLMWSTRMFVIFENISVALALLEWVHDKVFFVQNVRNMHLLAVVSWVAHAYDGMGALQYFDTGVSITPNTFVVKRAG